MLVALYQARSVELVVVKLVRAARWQQYKLATPLHVHPSNVSIQHSDKGVRAEPKQIRSLDKLDGLISFLM